MIDEIFQRIFDNNFSELPGLTIDASIPVPESLVNEVIEASLQGNKTISYCRVTIGPNNRVSADVKSPLLPWTIHLKMKLFSSVDFTGSPKVRAFLENNLLLGKLGALFKVLPDGIRVYDDQVAVEIGTFLPPQPKQLLELVKSADIHTTEGTVILDVRIEN
jgi:hypothetical protein